MSNFASRDLTHSEINAPVKLAGSEFTIQPLSTTAEAVVVPTDVDQFSTVPPNLAFEERIMRGNYDWRNSDLTEKTFHVTADQFGEWEWKRFHFDRNISSEEAIGLMKQDGYEAGQIGHIITFGEANLEEQQYPIIGLGSVAEIDLDLRVPVVWRDGGSRGLGLGWFDGGGWAQYCRFLGVRRRSVA